MIIHHEIIPNTPEWLAYRFNHDNASEAAAMLGLSKTTKRTELLHAKHTGQEKVFSEWVQRNVLDYGHTVEALVRPLVEFMLAEDFTPAVCSDGRLSASLDGMSENQKTLLEIKQWNAEIADQVRNGIMPEQHMPQCQQGLLITGAEKLIFAVGDGTPENLVTIDVYPCEKWFNRILKGWNRFAEDLAVFELQAPAMKVVKNTPETLPALRIEVSGKVMASNLDVYRDHAFAVIDCINMDLNDDQDIANGREAIKWCASVEEMVKNTKISAQRQAEPIDILFRTLDAIGAKATRARIDLSNKIEDRGIQIRKDIIAKATTELANYVAMLNDGSVQGYMPTITANFAEAVKGKRNISSMRDAASTLLANKKDEADITLERISRNLQILEMMASDRIELFQDRAQLIAKQPDDLTAIIKTRIAEAEAKDAIKAKEIRDKAQADADAKAQATIDAAAKAAAEEKRIEAEEINAKLIAAEFQAQAAINLAREKGAMPAVLLDSLSQTATALRDDAIMPAPAPAPAPAAAAAAAPAYQPRFAAPAPAATDDSAPTLTLGKLNSRIAPVQINAEGLRALGFQPAGTLRAALLYRESDFEAICKAIENHMRQVREAHHAEA